jgi:hypothetical protein
MDPTYAIHLWALTHDDADRERVELIRRDDPWTHVDPRRGKGEYNHAAPWYAYVRGEFPDYPERIVEVTYREMLRRLDLIRRDEGADPSAWDVHHWQDRNPVATEALVQLTLGAPQALYHGGLLHAPLRYFDPAGHRPGLPPDVAARVERVDRAGIALRLCNMHPLSCRDVLLQAGAFGEHEFRTMVVSDSEGGSSSDRSSDTAHHADVNARHVVLRLGPGTTVRLGLGLRRYRHVPTYTRPWDL